MIDDSTVRWQYKLFAHPKVLRKIDGTLQKYSEHVQGLSHSQLDTPEWHDLNDFRLYQMQISFFFFFFFFETVSADLMPKTKRPTDSVWIIHLHFKVFSINVQDVISH